VSLPPQSNVVYKFGGSSVRDAERMREVADIICSFPQYLPCVVLSAMGKVRLQQKGGLLQ
jgi:aspartate kinase